ncbi:MAG: flagellar biosynthesis protein FlhA [Gammaproteobacteria bacterium]|nr:MAG: flagellar biosynthesis protein FlhA [Gammaproteobacteria bacterium]
MTTANPSVPTPTANLTRFLGRISQHSDIIWAVAVVLIVAMMIIPMPPLMLDLLLTLNISISITILLIAMYVEEPLEFSIFPSLLLIVTLFRLSLNISSTRLILLNGQAGRVIEAFGDFVVGGNYVVGLVVFLLLMVIQFAVITNGAGRVAEVAARFTLDAMPGKQMAIDADLSAGIITEEIAKERREKISQEADFYGAMDGASKFVKGDAIAGIIITIINIIGGLVIGMLQLKMSAGEAAQTYTLLTVGDGLVSQIPSLIVSTATGIIVTRARSVNHMGADVMQQMSSSPRALAIVSAILAAFAIVPGLPMLPFLALSGVVGGASYLLGRTRRSTEDIEENRLLEGPTADGGKALPGTKEGSEEGDVLSLLRVDVLELEIGYGLIPLIDPKQGGDLLERVGYIRRQIAAELGFVVPKIRIRDNLRLAPQQYVIKLRGEEISSGQLQIKSLLAMPGPNVSREIEGLSTTEPVFGLPALWIRPEQQTDAEVNGYTVVEPPSIIITHLTEIIRQHAASLLGRQEVQELLDNLQQDYPAIVNEVQNRPGLGTVQRVLQALLQERVSIRDLVVILEAIADHAQEISDPDLLAEQARTYMGRSIANQYRSFDGALHVFTLSPTVEQMVANHLQQTSQGWMVNLAPDVAQRLLTQIAQQMEHMASQSHEPVLLTSQRIRLPMRRFVHRTLPTLAVLAFSELPPELEVRAEGMVELEGSVLA